MISGESVAGLGSSPGSKQGRAMCAVITLVTPASMAARNGTSSNVSSLSQQKSSIGNARWESVAVSPCPGKCLAVVISPWSVAPRTYAATSRATAWGDSPNERVLMIGLSGLLFTSATGEKLQWIPTARASSAVMRPSW